MANKKNSSATRTQNAGDTQTAQPTVPQKYTFPLGKSDFIIMAVAVVMIVTGFILIAGGGTDDGSFNPEIFSTRRIVVGPTIAFLGFIVMGVGIMWTDRKKKAQFELMKQLSEESDGKQQQ